MDISERLRLADDNPQNETALDVAAQGQTRRWVVMHQSSIWRPPTDVFELEDRLVVLVEIAGMRDGEFNVVLQDRRLMISGVRRRVVRERIAYHQMEVRYGEFRTEVSLPWPVDRDSVSATYREGFLRVELPHARNQQIHIVDVDSDQQDANA
ncbi:MAG: Hsp20/alpha crystallin family protein [Anaerolineae bacterium]|nr:Hsp20/alpha crystallin family protein [Anaerolineae bacterium]